jgi:hypothetical protein
MRLITFYKDYDVIFFFSDLLTFFGTISRWCKIHARAVHPPPLPREEAGSDLGKDNLRRKEDMLSSKIRLCRDSAQWPEEGRRALSGVQHEFLLFSSDDFL